MAPLGSGTTLTLPGGKQLLVDGMTLTPIAKIIQRDPAVFGATRDDFVPERWLGPHDIPDSAWRPYERGPRRCTGSELANMEARLILACTARQYDFVKVGQGELVLDEGTGRPVLDEKGYYKTKSTLFTVCCFRGWGFCLAPPPLFPSSPSIIPRGRNKIYPVFVLG